MPRRKVPCTGCGTPREVRAKDAQPLCQQCRRRGKVAPVVAAAKLAAVPNLDKGDSLEDVVDASIAAMAWLKATDKGTAEAARRLARVIDDAAANAERLADAVDLADHLAEEIPGGRLKTLYARLERLAAEVELGRVVMRCAPELVDVLSKLGGTPAERKGLEPDGPVESRLEQIRAGAANRRPTARAR